LAKRCQDTFVKKGGRLPKPLTRMHKRGVASQGPSFRQLCPAHSYPLWPRGHAGKSSSSPQRTVLARGFDSPARPSLAGRSGQRTKSFPLLCCPPKALAQRSPECPANANQKWWGAPPHLSNAFASANAGEREDSLRCVLRLPSTPHGVIKPQ
jgi:hypothetical protein